MIKASDAAKQLEMNKALKKANLQTRLERLINAPDVKILNIEKKIKEAIVTGQDFVFISLLNEEIELYIKYLEMYGYTLSLQSFLPSESCYRVYWS